jgi:uncharacterized membrane protein
MSTTEVRSLPMAPEHHGAFGQDAFGRGAEKAARLFGTPQYLVGQTILVVAWIAVNSVALTYHWDPYPFILLNLAFSTQAAYAAPLILLAQTRQADRDKDRELRISANARRWSAWTSSASPRSRPKPTG